MKPYTIQNNGRNKNMYTVSKNKSSKNPDLTCLNEILFIYADDGYAEIVVNSDILCNLISRLSQSHCHKLDDIAALFNNSQLPGKLNNPDNENKNLYVMYSTRTGSDKEIIYNAGNISELPQGGNYVYLKH